MEETAAEIFPHLRHSGHHHHGNLTNLISYQNSSLNLESSPSTISSLPRLQLPLHNFSYTELEEMNNITNTTDISSSSTVHNTSTITHHYISSLYSVIVPVMLFFCALTFVVNLIIVFSSRWCRKPMSPTLYFSISLALADAYASLVLATGLVINSLLPEVYGIKWGQWCFPLTLEAFRQGGVLITVSHLLALAINHWIGIVRPLHYTATMTRKTAWIVIILSWICPILTMFIYFSSIGGEGYLSSKCHKNSFLTKRTFRGFIASCFFAPLLLMSLIYLHIFLIVRNHHNHRLRYQSCQQLRRNIKAVVTTVLILGTYILGWMPAILFYIIVCDDCLIKLEDVPSEVKYPVGITINTLIILKAFVDPIIYAARMTDIQAALRKMRYTVLKLCCGKCIDVEPPEINERGLSKFNRSLYETKSARMSSFGSSSSSRRPATANANNSSQQQNHHQQNSFSSSHPYQGNNLLEINDTHNNSHKNNKSTFEMTEIN